MRFVRIEKYHEQTKCKLVFGIYEDTASATIVDMLKRKIVFAKGRFMPGQAPPGWFDDALQQWLEEVKDDEQRA